MDPRDGRERIPDPLPGLIHFARRRRAAYLRLRTTGEQAVAQVGNERHDRRLLTGTDASGCVQALRDAAGLDAGSGWATGRVSWSGGSLSVEVRRCLVGERALVRLQETSEDEDGACPVRRQLQGLLLSAVERNRDDFLAGAAPERVLALRLAIESSDLRSLVEAACDLALLAAAGGHEEARELARMGGQGLSILMQAGQTEAAALLVREARSLPRPETEFSRGCRRLLVAPVLAAGVHLPERREPAPLR